LHASASHTTCKKKKKLTTIHGARLIQPWQLNQIAPKHAGIETLAVVTMLNLALLFNRSQKKSSAF
jgi:hypothetical protein